MDRLGQGVAPIRLAADVGGTFTDVVLDTGEKYFTSKIATTIETPETAILEGVGIVLQKAGIKPSQVTGFIHGTTLATNALIERKGARTALITTEGFRDSIEIAYESCYDQYDLALQKPEPLVPRYLRYTVFERVDVRGRILRPLDTASVSQLVTELQKNEIEAVAIGLLHSYANPGHEQVVADMLRAAGVEAEISLSSEVCPEVREYERFMTTVCNAYVQPLMARYLRALQDALVAPETQPARAAAQRSAYCPELKAMIDYPVYERDMLVPGNCLSGPALVLEAQTTTYIPNEYNMYIDNRLNLVIDRRST